LARIRDTWVLTVSSPMRSVRAISALVRAVPSRSSTSCSRAVSRRTSAGATGTWRLVAKRDASRRVTEGVDQRVAAVATHIAAVGTHIAAVISSGGRLLIRKDNGEL
jgi:hypothetical protein